MNINKKSILIYGVIGVAIVSSVIIAFVLGSKQGQKHPLRTLQNQESSSQAAPTTTQSSISQKMKIGEIGEVKVKDEITGQEKPLVTPTLPPVIFNTSGKIISINAHSVVIMSDGQSFADGVSRKITCIFTDTTLTFSKNHLQSYRGLEGLKHLTKGMNILIDSSENIRGKTQIKVKTINVL